MTSINKIGVLDHGYVELLNLSGPVRRTDKEFDGDDTDPAKVARISFNNFEADRLPEADIKLCDYLLRNRHTSPFEMIETWWVLKVPMFLGEQIIRHRTASINKVSGRYSTFDEEWYIPEVVGGKASSNKQGQEDNLSSSLQRWFKDSLSITCSDSYGKYLYAVQEGVAPEHARLFLHANHYSTMVWKMDLHNLMNFLSLRLDSHAQIEARVYANALYDLLNIYLPETIKLFDKYRRLPQS
jgi:thymidylate synthase (FAD)